MKIGIAGAGGIGSNVADNLVRSGVEELLLVDFDRVEAANLNRQNYFLDQVGDFKVIALRDNLKKINNRINIEIINKKLNAENIGQTFRDCEVVVEAFDSKKYKKLILEKMAGSGKLCVSGSGVAGTDIDSIRTRKIDNCYIVGDFITDADNEKVYAPKLRLVTSIMSNLILEKSGFYEKNL